MEIITVDATNIEKEHICCAIANNKDIQVKSKKDWLRSQFEKGLVFKKGDVRGKCFIEYIPAENAWAPVEAKAYMYIDCFWISGQFKGKGYSNQLLEACIEDSKQKGKKGLVILSCKDKKKPYLCDGKYLSYKGFKVADHLDPYFDLMYLPFEESETIPKFKECVHTPEVKDGGFVLYYTHQCPFTVKYVDIVKEYAKAEGIEFKTILIQEVKEAQNAPTPFTTYSLFYNGKFITNEILSDKKFAKLITEIK